MLVASYIIVPHHFSMGSSKCTFNATHLLLQDPILLADIGPGCGTCVDLEISVSLLHLGSICFNEKYLEFAGLQESAKKLLLNVL